MANQLLDTALHLHALGHAVLPVKPDGSKAPAVAWKTYIDTPPTVDQLTVWFTGDQYDGLGIITGRDGFVMLEAEGRAVTNKLPAQLAQLLTDSGLDELWHRVCAGWMELTPSGGLHWNMRVVDSDGVPVVIPGNTKLARRPSAPDELAEWKTRERAASAEIENADLRERRLAKIEAATAETVPQVLFETRGAGGFTVTAPSNGRTHPAGKPWVTLAGGPETAAVLSVEEFDAVQLAMTTFDQMPTPNVAASAHHPAGEVGERPGDDYNARATWDDILIPRGWTKGRMIGGATAWTRPGKDKRDGISATTGKTLRSDGCDRLYVFTTSTEFEAEKPYDKLGAIALLEYGGDIAKAASGLRSLGYGKPPEERHLSIVTDVTETSPAEILGYPVDGTAALAPITDIGVQTVNTIAHSDDANALLLVQRFGDKIRFCVDRGRWYAWNGIVWEPCHRNAGPARELAKLIARALPEHDKKDIDFKKKSLSAVGISNMLAQAASIPAVAVSYAQLDAHPWELNTPAGIVDLRTGELKAADPDRLHTRMTSCSPDPEADQTAWLAFLHTTFNGDEQLISYMQRLVGYSAVGTVGAHVLPYCYGSGGNGKGVFLETSTKVLGDYATTAPSGFLMTKLFQGHETEIARLAGARMVVCSEVNDDDRFDEARVKQLTGGDSLTARFMQQDHFTFAPSHQLWAMGNHQPSVRSGGPSFWRRLRLIPFLHAMPEDQVIDGLQDILASNHGPAILSWIIAGAVAYSRHGLQDPPVVLAATDSYQRDQDTVSRFLEEACRIGGTPHVQTKVSIVRTAYEAWCHETGDVPVTAKAFGAAIARAGIESKRTNSARFYSGLALITDDTVDDWRDR